MLPSLSLGGLHTFRMFHPVTHQDEKLLEELGKWYEEGKGGFWLPKCLHLMIQQVTKKNLTTTVGRAYIAKLLCNTAVGTNKYVNYFAIGTDTTPAAVGDTTLGTETFRKAVTSALDSSNTANIATFIGASEANFNWEEWGHFIDGTASADSGTMLSHLIDSSINKAAPNTVTVDSVYTIADA